MKITTRELVMTGLMIALAAILAQYPINGSIGLDAIPAFFGAAAMTPVLGGFVGAVAHLLIASFTGFMFTVPLHLIIAGTMFLSCFVYGYVRKHSNRYAAMIAGVLMNGPVSLMISAFAARMLGMEFSGMMMFLALIGPLTIVAAINVILADILYGLVGAYVPKSKVV